MRDTNGAIDWYRANESYPGSIGFDPDGMCLKICRTARDIPAMYPSAISAQIATPDQYRVERVADLNRGMFIFFDDPADSNPYGHIVTMVARVKDADPNSLSSILVRTNSVRSNQIVVVRGDYFQRYWGDEYQFGATSLNGQVVPDLQEKPTKPPKPTRKPALGKNPKRLNRALDILDDAIARHKADDHPRLVTALTRDRLRLADTIQRFQ